MIRNILKLRILISLSIPAVIAAGIYAYSEIPQDAFPDISPVVVPIFAEAPGLAAEEVELTIAQPIENAMSGLPSVTLVKSTSGFGMGVIYVYFKDSVDIYFARQLVAERLRGAESLLPSGIPKPELGPISTGLGQIFIYYLQADAEKTKTEGKELNTYLRELNDFIVKPQLQSVPGVTAILSMGGHVLQYQVQLNPEEMRRYNISFDDVAAALQANNRNVGGQYIEIGSEEYLVRGIGMLRSLDDLKNITIREIDGVPLRLDQVSIVRYGPDIRRGVVSRNGKEEVVAGVVLKLYGENTSRVIAQLHKKLQSVSKSLPAGVRIVPCYDQADLVDNAGKTVETALWQGVVLVLIVLALALWNFRAAMIVALAMPFCASLAVLGLYGFGFSANLMSLGGIAIALGMLVDGSIVVVENVMRKMSESAPCYGDAKLNLVADAAREVARPIAFALLIIIAVFIPIFLFDGVEGKMFKPLAFSIVAALAGSIWAAVVNAPVLSSFLPGFSWKGQARQERIAKRISSFYLPLLGGAIKLRYLLAAVVGLCFIASVWMLARCGREFIPTLEEGSILVTVSMAPSIGLTQSERVVRNLESMILKHPQVKETVSRIGRPEAGSHPHPVNFAEIQIELHRVNGRVPGAAEREKIVQSLRRELQQYPGISINFSQPIQNAFDELLSGTRAYFALKLYGENLATLQTKAEEIRRAIADIPGVVDLSVEQSYGQPQLQIRLNREAMAKLGVTGAEVMRLIESAIGGENVGTIYRDTRRYDINVRLGEDFRSTPEQLGKLKVRTASGRYVELARVADLRLAEGPVQINREKIQRRWTIQGNVAGHAPSEIVRDMRKAIAEKVPLPAGYFVEFGGQFENQERAMKKLAIVVPIVIVLIFSLLWFTFGSLRNSLTVMVNVPLALIGGVFGLWASGLLLSVPAAIGFIALLGIAMQDAVVMVSDFRQLRKNGLPLREAVLQGSAERFRAVVLTTLTTLLGLTPLLLSHGIGAEVQKPLAVIVVFGLASSTLLTLFFLPVLYYQIERWFGDNSSVRQDP
ncbi:MAG: CusA/CzcA family heavy metal efflux RND transporter [Victivallaceae bacterium]|nr:CusA/CzcA family heavy metal efflux RND transporter [Victivallaceae bacterium]